MQRDRQRQTHSQRYRQTERDRQADRQTDIDREVEDRSTHRNAWRHSQGIVLLLCSSKYKTLSQKGEKRQVMVN